jgi:diadenylate cyclase
VKKVLAKLPENLLNLLPDINLINILDILVVAVLVYLLMLQLRGTRAVQLIKGLIVLLVVATVSSWLGLYTINWIMNKIMAMVIVAIPVVFQPELRRALERLGRGKFFARHLYFLGEEAAGRMTNELTRAMISMSKRKMGGLIVMEQETGIYDYMETGIKIDALVSGELLLNIFTPSTPMHDGAIIIRGDRVAAAGCFLPLSENPDLDKDLGTRHRAGIGITEHSDALVLIVSEESGIISAAHEGRLTRNLDENSLRELLTATLLPPNRTNSYFWHRRS